MTVITATTTMTTATTLQKILTVIASVLSVGILTSSAVGSFDNPQVAVIIVAVLSVFGGTLILAKKSSAAQVDIIISIAGAVVVWSRLNPVMEAEVWGCLVIAWLHGWVAVEKIIRQEETKFGKIMSRAVPWFFGLWILIFWETLIVGLEVPTVLLPPPSMIVTRILSSTAILFADFKQTIMKAVVIGYVIGCGSAVIFAIIVDKNDFLKRGLLPLGNFVAALPIIGVAPIMVMWFGFDWQSKAAVVVMMTFFPMMVNTITGLNATPKNELDLFDTYASNYWKTLFKLRMPTAMPFIFNALKINSTLALIGAIVAEFFGTPIVGIGFRISTEVGRMNLDMVWAEIVVAAVAGSVSYGVISLVERRVTAWHPSYRTKTN